TEEGVRRGAEIAKIFGAGYNSAVWVDVVLNGECVGNYQLYEQTRISEDRVDIYDWESAAEDVAKAIKKAEKLTDDDEDALAELMQENLEWMTSGVVSYNDKTYTISDYYDELPSSTNGGFLMELDSNYDEISKFMTSRSVPIMFKYPEFINTNTTVFSQIQSYVQDFEDAVYSSDKTITKDGKKISYSELCDMDSLITYWLSNEVLTSEFGFRSTYFSKDIDGPLVFGPIWDFDFSAGCVNPWDPIDETQWSSNEKSWFPQIMEDPYFAVKAGELYRQKASQLRNMVEDDGTLEQWYALIRESALNNSQLWPYSRGFEDDYLYFKQWLTARLDWIDAQLENDDTAMSSLGVKTSQDFSISLNAKGLLKTGDVSYCANKGENESYVVQLNIKNGSYSAFDYYINAKHAGKVDLTNSAASASINASLLKDDGSANVITVWLLDENGQPAAMQSLVLRIADTKAYLTVTFIDNGTETTQVVLPGTRVFLPKAADKENMIFTGWIIGNKVYKSGESIIVDGNTVVTAGYATCKNGTIIHVLEKDGDNYVCSKCKKVLTAEKNYISAKKFVVTFNVGKYNHRYTGQPVKPYNVISYNGKELTEGVDYTLECKNNIYPGFASYTVTGLESAGYTGSFTMSYKIIPREMAKVTVKADKTQYTATGKAITPVFTLTSAGRTLVQGTDYTVELSNNVNPGTATAVFTGIGNYSETKEVTFSIKNGISSVTLSSTSYTYDGKEKKPTVTVKGTNGKTLKNGTDYTVTYSSGRKNVGEYTVKVTGIGDCTGSKSVKYKIIPGKATGLKVSSRTTSSLTLTWTKTAGATGYRVYSYNASTKKYTKLADVKTNSYTVKKLKSGTKYSYAVKPYAKIGSVVYWGSVSSVYANVTTPAAPSVKLSTSSGKLTVSYAKVTGASGYEIYYKVSGGSYKKLTATTKTSYTKALTKGKTYSVKVRAYVSLSGSKVYGAFSPAKSITIK
ncbi:MAG: fibronectin type III domain-containing protein, partial [Acutalibacteraceae bacterium]